MLMTSSKSGKAPNQVARRIARWEDDGGAMVQGLPRSAEQLEMELVIAERRMLHWLGIAVVARWNDLPVGVQRTLFAAASESRISRTPDISAQLARFLHIHKNDDVGP